MVSRSILVITSIALLLGACSLTSPDTEQDTAPLIPDSTAVSAPAPTAERGITTITFATQQIGRQFYEPLAKKFSEENPNIKVQIVKIEDPSDLSVAARAADTALVYFDETLGQTPLTRSTAALNLKPFIDGDASLDRSDFITNTLESVSIGDNVYMLPRMLSVSLLAYNKDLWVQRGLSAPKPTMAWRELVDAATALSEPNTPRYGLLDSSYFVTSLSSELFASDTNLAATPLSQLRLDNPAFSDALARIAALVNAKALYIPALNNQIIGNDLIGKQLRQQVGARQVGIWDYFDTPYDPPPTFKVGLLNGGYPYRGGTQGYIISSGTRHSEAAWRWVSFLSQHEPETFFDAIVINVPARHSFAERSGYWKKLSAEDAAVIRAAVALPAAPPSIPDTIIRNHADILITAVNAVVSGKRSATQAAADAQAAVEQVLDVATPVPSPAPPGPVVVATPIPEAVQPNAVPITFSASGLPTDQLQALVQRFAAAHPDIAVRLTTASGAGTLTTLARSSDCFTSFQTPQADDASALLDLQPLIDADATFPRGDIPAAVLARFQRDGRLLGLPLQLGLPALHANPAVLAQASIATPAADWTLDAFRAAAQQANSGTGANRTYGFATNDGAYSLSVWLQQRGVLPVTEQNGTLAPVFTAPDLRVAVQAYLELLRTSSPHTRLTGYTRVPLADESAGPLSQGQVAFWLDASDRYGSTGAITATGTLAPLPQDANAVPNFTVAVAGYIAAQTKQPEACWRWLRFLSDQPTLLPGTYPARTSQAAALAEPAASVYAAAASALARTTGPTTDVFDDPRIDLFWFYRAVDRALQGKNLERELADAQTTTEAYLACVAGGGAGPACATQVDPEYTGLQQAGP